MVIIYGGARARVPYYIYKEEKGGVSHYDKILEFEF
jgi:hypothetical protein